MGTAPFRQAKFTWITEGGKQERRIVASIGNNSIVWDFAAFKRATAPGSGVREYLDYTLQTTMGQVVDSGFAHANWAGARSAQTLVRRRRRERERERRQARSPQRPTCEGGLTERASAPHARRCLRRTQVQTVRTGAVHTLVDEDEED